MENLAETSTIKYKILEHSLTDKIQSLDLNLQHSEFWKTTFDPIETFG